MVRSAGIYFFDEEKGVTSAVEKGTDQKDTHNEPITKEQKIIPPEMENIRMDLIL